MSEQGELGLITGERSEYALLADVADNAAILAMGEDGIGAETVTRLRSELLHALDELRRRWELT